MASARHYSGLFACPSEHSTELMCLQSLGWEHYEVHEPEPHILLFKSVLPTTYTFSYR